jgi:hypothetical protein
MALPVSQENGRSEFGVGCSTFPIPTHRCTQRSRCSITPKTILFQKNYSACFRYLQIKGGKKVIFFVHNPLFNHNVLVPKGHHMNSRGREPTVPIKIIFDPAGVEQYPTATAGYHPRLFVFGRFAADPSLRKMFRLFPLISA